MATSTTIPIKDYRNSTDFIPADYSELFDHYYFYVVSLVSRMGIDPQEAEDVAMGIIRTFYERKVLEDYDPTFTRGGMKAAVFRTFLSSFVIAYLPSYRTKQRVEKYRSGLSIDVPLVEEDDWTAILGAHEDDHEQLHWDELIQRVRAHLATVKPRNHQDQLEMLLLFDLALLQVNESGRVSCAELAELFGVSRWSVNKWMARLREELQVVLAS